MNLLQFKNKYFVSDNNEITIENFRQDQYNNLSKYCESIVNYVTQQNKNIFKFYSVNIKSNINYFGVTNSKISDVVINIEMEDGTIKEFLSFFFPALIEENHFFINGNLYTPLIYAIDMPIVIKKESIKLWSLFNSITFNPKRNTCIFCMNNIPINYILTLFLLYNGNEDSLEIYNNYIEKYNIKSTELEESDIILYFNKLFKKKYEDIDSIIDVLESIFFDEYTKELYELQYIDELKEINLKNIVRKAISDDINDNRFNFIDLDNKRLIFMELLLKPIYKRLSNMIIDIIKGRIFDEIIFNDNFILKHFLTSPGSKDNPVKNPGLAGNYLYDTANLYSSILNHKINMVPIGLENSPKEIQGMHQSHFKKICPVSVASIEPGKVVSVVYGTKLDKFGRFI